MANNQTAEQIVDELTGVAVLGREAGRSGSVAKGAGAKFAAAIPTAEVDPAQVPKKLDDLTEARNWSYDLSTHAAAELGIPIAGSASGSMSRRVVVLERSASKTVVGGSGTEYSFGYALRLCVTVDKWDGSTKITLPFLAASAQMGQIQASWMLQVVGLAGAKMTELATPPTELNVETFVLAKQSLTAMIGAVNDASTHFEAALLSKRAPEQIREEEYRRAAAVTFGLSRIARRSSAADTLKRIASVDPIVNSAIDDVYQSVAGTGGDQKPSEAAAAKCRILLGGVEADV